MTRGNAQAVRVVRPGDNYGEDAAMARELQALGSHIKVSDPLPISPCLKLKNGLIHDWDHSLAERSDLCVNCDENGNEDPAAWQGRYPLSWNLPDEPVSREPVPDPALASPPRPATEPVLVKPRPTPAETAARFGLGSPPPPDCTVVFDTPSLPYAPAREDMTMEEFLGGIQAKVIEKLEARPKPKGRSRKADAA